MTKYGLINHDFSNRKRGLRGIKAEDEDSYDSTSIISTCHKWLFQVILYVMLLQGLKHCSYTVLTKQV